MSKHKKQHFIPVCYLKEWCDPSAPLQHTPYVWIFDKDGHNGRKKAPENIFYETDMYTIKKADGERDLVLEHGLKQLEEDFTLIRERKLKHNLNLDLMEHIKVCTFIAAMHSRTKLSREHHRGQWAEALSMMDKMMEWAKTATPEQRKQMADMSFSLLPRGKGLLMNK